MSVASDVVKRCRRPLRRGAEVGRPRSRPDLQGGTMQFLDGGDADVLCYRRGDRHAVALNFSADARPVTWRLSPGQVVLSTHLDRDPGSPAPGALRGGEGVLVETHRPRP